MSTIRLPSRLNQEPRLVRDPLVEGEVVVPEGVLQLAVVPEVAVGVPDLGQPGKVAVKLGPEGVPEAVHPAVGEDRLPRLVADLPDARLEHQQQRVQAGAQARQVEIGRGRARVLVQREVAHLVRVVPEVVDLVLARAPHRVAQVDAVLDHAHGAVLLLERAAARELALDDALDPVLGEVVLLEAAGEGEFGAVEGGEGDGGAVDLEVGLGAGEVEDGRAEVGERVDGVVVDQAGGNERAADDEWDVDLSHHEEQ